MSAQVNFPLTNEAGCLDPLQSALRSRNVWYESDGGVAGDGIDLRWVCLAVEPQQMETALTVLQRCTAPVDAEVHRQAVIAHLHADGRTEWVPVVQIEFILRAESIVPMLDRLQAAAVLSSDWDHVTIIRRLNDVWDGDCQILPAAADAPYSHFVRWRRLPARAETAFL